MIMKKLLTHSFVKFFFTGATGVLINLCITGIFAAFFIPESHFYIASIIGTACNLAYNFTLHTMLTFKTKSKHKRRFGAFVAYSLLMASFQEFIVAHITPIIGIQFLLVVKAAIVLIFSIITYIILRFFLFKEK